jgi:hypothetical protein
MSNPRLDEVVHLLDPPPGTRLWYGGATAMGCLRGVPAKQAAWKPSPKRHSIWELTLHLAYWKYAVRRNLEGSASGRFTRSPSNWPHTPNTIDEKSWNEDRSLLRTEHEALIEVVRSLGAKKLDEKAKGSGTYRFIDLIYGVIMHDTYHVGQIQTLKRLSPAAHKKT